MALVLWDSLLAILATEGWRVWPVPASGVHPIERKGVLWCLADNGGELLVWRPNTQVLPANVPTYRWHLPLDAGTLTYRVLCVLRGEPWETDVRAPELLDVLEAA